MSRLASGDEAVLLKAREAIASAQTVKQLRQAQAVVLPLDYAMSLADTAQVIGVSPGWACQLRKRFMRGQVVGAPDAPTPGGRKRENMSVAQEREFLAPFLELAAAGGVLVVGQIKAALVFRFNKTFTYPGKSENIPIQNLERSLEWQDQPQGRRWRSAQQSNPC